MNIQEKVQTLCRRHLSPEFGFWNVMPLNRTFSGGGLRALLERPCRVMFPNFFPILQELEIERERRQAASLNSSKPRVMTSDELHARSFKQAAERELEELRKKLDNMNTAKSSGRSSCKMVRVRKVEFECHEMPGKCPNCFPGKAPSCGSVGRASATLPESSNASKSRRSR